MTNTATESQERILQNRIRAAEEAMRWCRANGRSAAAATKECFAALAQLKALQGVKVT